MSPSSLASSPVIGLIPLDARPVCLAWPQQLAAMAGVTLLSPSSSQLGNLKVPAQQADLAAWVQWFLTEHPDAPLILSLDTLIYGGLIPSRLGLEPESQLLERFLFWKDVLSKASKTLIGFASILRIPAYNNSMEEPDYWAEYGESLSDFSIQVHRDGFANPELANNIPLEVRSHFLATRRRNLNIHRHFLDWVKEKILSRHVICLDDTGEYGLNRQEADLLQSAVQGHGLSQQVFFQTGADEIASSSLSRLLWTQYSPQGNLLPSVWVEYSNPATAQRVAKFDGLPITTLVGHHVAACGATLATSETTADAILWVHTPPDNETAYGDYCESPAPRATKQQLESLQRSIAQGCICSKPLIVADVAAANGGSPQIVEALLNNPEALHTLKGYSAWNTPGNTMGSALAMGLIALWALNKGCLNTELLKQALFTRLVDDGVYQSQVRQSFSATAVLNKDDELMLTELLKPYGQKILSWLKFNKMLTASFPCHRRFEISLCIEPPH